MAFVRKKVKTFKWPVEVKEPSETKPGKFDSHEFTAIFKRLSRSAISDMAEKEEDALLESILVGWEGIEEEDGAPIAFSKKTLGEFADDPYWVKAVISAYTATYNEAEVGN
jgi:hypothetical protein